LSIRKIIYIVLSLVLLSCQTQTKTKTSAEVRCAFSADSAYTYIAQQVDFGSRVPGTEAHKRCGDWLVGELSRHGLQVSEQVGEMINYAGQQQLIRNIAAYMEGSTKQAILLCAHWDCRPWSDEEEDDDLRLKPVMGANDGASGVGVILEMVRQMAMLEAKGEFVPSIQVVFFDCEDMGTPSHYTGKERQDTWCLGSQLWAKEYARTKADTTRVDIQYGILLDMVGDPSATFPCEYFSMQYASGYVDNLWHTASKLGYGRYFTKESTYYPITDDHYYVNTLADIPCLDVIDYKPNSTTGFSSWWHTQRDDMRNINKQTLQAVGETVMTTICSK
jgi:Zn-dependent M28 family amino/carboxypeptidase